MEAEQQELIAELFRRIGLEEGIGWQRQQPEAVSGVPFRAPAGEIEVVAGRQLFPGLLVECSDLESVQRIAAQFAHGSEEKNLSVSELQNTDWNARIFTVSCSSDRELELTFWQADDPAKNTIAAVEGKLDASGMRFGIVVSRWNQVITERLLHGALDALRRSGAGREEITIVRVPGAFELPSGARALAVTGKVDAIITLGCLIRGETTHYEHIAEEATRGIGQSAQETGVPHAYGLLTCETLEQALDRAGLKAGNKGFEAAMSAVEMVSVQRQLRR